VSGTFDNLKDDKRQKIKCNIKSVDMETLTNVYSSSGMSLKKLHIGAIMLYRYPWITITVICLHMAGYTISSTSKNKHSKTVTAQSIMTRNIYVKMNTFSKFSPTERKQKGKNRLCALLLLNKQS
jgi:hypothetical protein